MAHKIERWSFLLGPIVVLAFLVWLSPYGASAYHVERAGQELDQVTVTAENQDLKRLDKAMAHLQAALIWRENNAQAYRLLSKVHLLRKDMPGAAEAMVQYTNLQPRNPQGWWELAQMYDTAGMSELAVAAWRAGGFTAQDLIMIGQEASRRQDYEKALLWYKRATLVDPEIGDGWYYVGLAFQNLEYWGQALAAHERAIELNNFRYVRRSSPYYQTGLIYQWHLEARNTDRALAAYEKAIEIDDFGASTEEADCHYRRGEVLWWMGANTSEYLAEYQTAIKLDPEHVSAHLQLGMTYYFRFHDMDKAEAEFQRAIELNPNHEWTYYYWGEVYRYEGQEAKAKMMYERALKIDPEFAQAREHLEEMDKQP
jgi:tetratricopeptide (TPR) repeat protein